MCRAGGGQGLTGPPPAAPAPLDGGSALQRDQAGFRVDATVSITTGDCGDATACISCSERWQFMCQAEKGAGSHGYKIPAGLQRGKQAVLHQRSTKDIDRHSPPSLVRAPARSSVRRCSMGAMAAQDVGLPYMYSRTGGTACTVTVLLPQPLVRSGNMPVTCSRAGRLGAEASGGRPLTACKVSQGQKGSLEEHVR